MISARPLFRLRLVYAVSGPMRYISHLEQVRVWERAMRRVGFPLAYTGGFTPRPRLQIALPLPLGFASEAEWLDVWLEAPLAPGEAIRVLKATLPNGLTVRQAEEVPVDAPSLPAQVRAADYGVVVETTVPEDEIRRRIEELLAATTLPRERRGRPYDLRPLVLSLRLEEAGFGHTALAMRLSAQEGATGRPEEVLDALGLANGFFQVTRRGILFAEGWQGERRRKCLPPGEHQV
ncbi:MAG: TIGR03936 family radical SAM-associated protein [Anaerolineae bacterium]|nr:TIGR03936 family radical SAM-associated protein [Anaerolineae bacterium]MDW8067409.1 TIGR03936 family radical SAM-associated protein [Anaerolineae bacterium]